MKYAALTSQHSIAGNRFSTPFSSPSKQTSIIGKLTISNVRTLYVLYASSLFIVIVAAITFWVCGIRQPILFSYETGLWIQSNQNFVTILCTALGTLISVLTVFLLNGLLVLMGKLVIVTQGASLSTVEVWNRILNRDFILDKERIRLSVLTCASSFAAFYLATAYTTLITPTSVLVTESISGTEVDFASDEFWGWYESKDTSGNWNRTVIGCQWYTYRNDKGNTTFPTCPYNNDPVSLLSAGVAASQSGLTSAKPAVNYLDKRFEGSTGGVLPLAWAGFSPFTDIQFDHWANGTTYPSYNYTLAQQGLTAEVSCQSTDTTPLHQTIEGSISNSILGIDNGHLNIVNFTWICPGGSQSSSQVAVPFESWATLVICESPDVLKEYTIYLGAFGSYADSDPGGSVSFFPNLTCSLKPLLTNAIVKYTANDGLFRVQHQDKIMGTSYRVPNETSSAVDRIFSLAISNSENMVIDSLHGLVQTNTSISIASGMEHTIRGYIEYFATNLRMYYAANEPPGRRPITGNYTVWRVGYDGELIVLAGLLPPLVFICGIAIAYITLGVRAGTAQITHFDPFDILSLLTASTTGGYAGVLSLSDTSASKGDKQLLSTKVRYDVDKRRLEGAATRRLAGNELELSRLQARAPLHCASDSNSTIEYSDASELVASSMSLQQPASE